MRESLIPVTKWLDSPTDHEAMSIAAQKGFQINGLLALVED